MVRNTDYRGCPSISAAAEYPGTPAITAVTGDHRAWVRSWFGLRLTEAGVPDAPAATATTGHEDAGRHRGLVSQLVLLYDGAMVAAELDADPAQSARNARDAAAGLVRTAVPR